VIRSFADKETAKVFAGEHSFKLPVEIQERAQLRLTNLDAATSLNDLRFPPSNHLEALKGGRKGQHSVRINQQWRICFRFRDGHAFDVEIVDYH
jgi:toxin HigB-1